MNQVINQAENQLLNIYNIIQLIQKSLIVKYISYANIMVSEKKKKKKIFLIKMKTQHYLLFDQ